MTDHKAPGLQNTFATELEGLYAPWSPQGFPAPAVLLLNRSLAAELGIDATWLEERGARVLSGSEIAPGSRPLSQAYGGHQFGHFNPLLGDGRAGLIGEVVAPGGERFDLQLKGAGLTPFSRNGDGRAALDSVLREYILSEAMHALGVPTTRALAVVTTGETVLRQRRAAAGAVLTRVASSHLRIGTLEFFAFRGENEKLRRLVDYALRRHYPERAETDNPAKALLDAVAVAQAELVARWMLVGFVHGVMNTDNVTLSGETIDYGPCAFMDAYNPNTVFSQIDHAGRYAFGRQPTTGSWNVTRMAEALLRILDDDPDAAVALATESLDLFRATYDATWLAGMRAKLGLSGEDEGDIDLFVSLLVSMHQTKADYTQTFRRLSASLAADGPALDEPALAAWSVDWRKRLHPTPLPEVIAAMDRVNPIYVARNHNVEEALDAAVAGDMAPAKMLMDVLSRPFEFQPGRHSFAEPAPEDFGHYQTHCNT